MSLFTKLNVFIVVLKTYKSFADGSFRICFSECFSRTQSNLTSCRCVAKEKMHLPLTETAAFSWTLSVSFKKFCTTRCRGQHSKKKSEFELHNKLWPFLACLFKISHCNNGVSTTVRVSTNERSNFGPQQQTAAWRTLDHMGQTKTGRASKHHTALRRRYAKRLHHHSGDSPYGGRDAFK